jgi:hypothetical protein
MPKITEQAFRDMVMDAISESEDVEADYVMTFEETGVMTSDTGFTVKVDGGAVFYITIQERR